MTPSLATSAADAAARINDPTAPSRSAVKGNPAKAR